MVIEPIQDGAELALQATDSTLEPALRLLAPEPVWDRNHQRL
jgi:hypothetical protein